MDMAYHCPDCAKLTGGRCWRHASETLIVGEYLGPPIVATGGYVPSELDQLRAQVAAQQDEIARLKEAAEDARMGHVRLDETRAKEAKGDLYARISWIIDLLTREKSEIQHMLTAVAHEKDELRARANAAEHRRAAAEYRAQRIVLDEELKAKLEAAEATLAQLREEQERLKTELAEARK